MHGQIVARCRWTDEIYLEIEEALLHLPLIRDHLVVLCASRCSKFDVSVTLEVKFSEAAHVPSAIDVD